VLAGESDCLSVKEVREIRRWIYIYLNMFHAPSIAGEKSQERRSGMKKKEAKVERQRLR
jgi:hypothetical protein